MIIKWRRVMLEKSKTSGKMNVLNDYLIGYSQSKQDELHFLEQALEFINNPDCKRIILEKENL